MIVIVDDNPEILEELKEVAEAQGFQTITTTCGKEARRLVKELDATAVLTDVSMYPSGYWLAKHVRKESPNTCIGMVSGDPVLLSELKSPQADAFFVKGIEFSSRIIAWLRKVRRISHMN